MDPIVDDILMHYGVKRRSGRYPWGSGENPYQHGGDFLARVEELEALGKSQKEIAEELKMSTTDLRMQVRVAKHERRALQAERAKSLREEGKTLDEIAKIMGYNNTGDGGMVYHATYPSLSSLFASPHIVLEPSAGE